MTTQFEFHLVGADAPEGELDADQLIAIVGSLKEVATKIGRSETSAEPVGRAPERVQQVARLTIGLAPGSTTVRVHRTGVAGALDFVSAEEQAFDEKFDELVQAFARDERPKWVGDSLALATSHLISALKQTAPAVEFTAEGQLRCAFQTGAIHKEVWQTPTPPSAGVVTFTGRLYAVNLKTHRLQVRDDVGNEVALLRVVDDARQGGCSTPMSR